MTPSERIAFLVRELGRSFTPEVESTLAATHVESTREFSRFVDRWPLEATNTLREASVLLLAIDNDLVGAAELLQKSFDPRTPRGCEIVVTRCLQILNEGQRKKLDEALSLLETNTELGLDLARRARNFFDAAKKRSFDVRLFEGWFRCGDEAILRQDVDRWLAACPHHALDVKRAVEEVTGTVLPSSPSKEAAAT